MLARIGDDLWYDELLPSSDELNIGEGVIVSVLRLEKVIEIKEHLGGEKDLAVLGILRETLRQKG